jgi:hypothetical protein
MRSLQTDSTWTARSPAQPESTCRASTQTKYPKLNPLCPAHFIFLSSPPHRLPFSFLDRVIQNPPIFPVSLTDIFCGVPKVHVRVESD